MNLMRMPSKSYIAIVVFFVLSMLCLIVAKAEPTALDPEKELMLESALNRLQHWSVDVKQELLDEEGGLVDRRQGHMLLKRPNQLRYQVHDPVEQSIYVNGEHVWTVDPALKQAMHQPIKALMRGSPATLLLYPVKEWLQWYTIEFENLNQSKVNKFQLGQDDHLVRVTLSGKPDTQLGQVVLVFAHHRLLRLSYTNHLSQTMVLYFSNHTYPDRLDNKLFEYQPDKDVQLISI